MLLPNQKITLSQSPETSTRASPDSYFCTTYPPLEKDTYITEIAALPGVSVDYIHHIILNVHEKPLLNHVIPIDPNQNSKSTYFNTPYNCKHTITFDSTKEHTTYYAWAMNANPLKLPSDSAFKVKKGYSFQLEVHYLSAVSKIEGLEEISPGLELEILSSNQKPEYLVGTWYVGAEEFKIPPFTANYPVDISAKVPRDLTIFAARVHAHQWSKTNTAYVKRKKKVFQLPVATPIATGLLMSVMK